MTTHDRPWSLKLFGPKVDIMRVKHNSVNSELSEDFSVYIACWSLVWCDLQEPQMKLLAL